MRRGSSPRQVIVALGRLRGAPARRARPPAPRGARPRGRLRRRGSSRRRRGRRSRARRRPGAASPRRSRAPACGCRTSSENVVCAKQSSSPAPASSVLEITVPGVRMVFEMSASGHAARAQPLERRPRRLVERGRDEQRRAARRRARAPRGDRRRARRPARDRARAGSPSRARRPARHGWPPTPAAGSTAESSYARSSLLIGNAHARRREDRVEVAEATGLVAVVAGGGVEEQRAPEVDGDGADATLTSHGRQGVVTSAAAASRGTRAGLPRPPAWRTTTAEGVHAVLDRGGDEIGRPPADHQLFLEADGGRRAREDLARRSPVDRGVQLLRARPRGSRAPSVSA